MSSLDLVKVYDKMSIRGRKTAAGQNSHFWNRKQNFLLESYSFEKFEIFFITKSSEIVKENLEFMCLEI